MLDMQAAFEKLQKDAVDCGLISQHATDPEKKELFGRIAQHLQCWPPSWKVRSKRNEMDLGNDLRPEREPRPR